MRSCKTCLLLFLIGIISLFAGGTLKAGPSKVKSDFASDKYIAYEQGLIAGIMINLFVSDNTQIDIRLYGKPTKVYLKSEYKNPVRKTIIFHAPRDTLSGCPEDCTDNNTLV